MPHPLLAALQVIMQKLSEKAEYKPAVLPFADGIMDTLLRVFAGQSSTVHEEAMLAVGACTYACGRQFTKYLPAFYPYLQRGLTNHQEWQVSSTHTLRLVHVPLTGSTHTVHQR